MVGEMFNISIPTTTEDTNITTNSTDGVIQLVVPEYIHTIYYTGTADLQGTVISTIRHCAIFLYKFLLFCGSLNRPRYSSCPPIHLFVCPFVLTPF